MFILFFLIFSMCWQDSAWWRATRMNQRRGALITFVWPPSLQVTGRAATATSVNSVSSIICSNWAWKKRIISIIKSKQSPTKLCVKARTDWDVILFHFDRVDRWVCKVFSWVTETHFCFYLAFEPVGKLQGWYVLLLAPEAHNNYLFT